MFNAEKAKKDGTCLYCGEEVKFIAGPDINGIYIIQIKECFGCVYASSLQNIPTKKQGWINIYSVPTGRATSCKIHPTKESADRDASLERITCIQIEWEE